MKTSGLVESQALAAAVTIAIVDRAPSTAVSEMLNPPAGGDVEGTGKCYQLTVAIVAQPVKDIDRLPFDPPDHDSR